MTHTCITSAACTQSSWPHRCGGKRGLLSGGLCLGLLAALLAQPATAQIVPDHTLPNHSIVTTTDQTQAISGGTQRGVNLYHSFEAFSIPTGGIAHFQNGLHIQTILTRVTGSSVSQIDGLIRANGTANLFFLNPNGIVFGPNARLQIGGSFVASTAPQFQFADGSEFSATRPQAPPLLTINVPIGLQYGRAMGELRHGGQLSVPNGQQLVLHGSQVTQSGGLSAPGGTVQVLGDRIILRDQASIDVSDVAGGGRVAIGGDVQGQGTLPRASQTWIGPGVTIRANALEQGNGGQVVVWADGATRFYGTIQAQGGPQGGNGGWVEVSGKQQLIYRGTVHLNANGTPGTLLLDPTNIVIVNGAGAADDGEIIGDGTILDTDPGDTFTISEAALESLSGNANVILQATNAITLEALADNTLNFLPGTGSISFIAGGAIAMNQADTIQTNGRAINLSGSSLSLGRIRTGSDVGDGVTLPTVGSNAGAIQLTARTGNLSARQLDATALVSSGTAGNGGAIRLDAPQGSILVERGILANASTLTLAGRGNPSGTAGAISLNASGTIQLGSSDITDAFDFGVFEALYRGIALSATSGGGAAGAIQITSANGDIILGGTVQANGLGNQTIAFSAPRGSVRVDRGITGFGVDIAAQGDITIGDTPPFSSLNASVLQNSAGGPGTNAGNISLVSQQGSIDVAAGIFTTSDNGGGNAGRSGDIRLQAGDLITVGQAAGESFASFPSRLGIQAASLSQQTGVANTSGSITLVATNDILVASPFFFGGNDPRGNGSVSSESIGRDGSSQTGAIQIISTQGNVTVETGVLSSSSTTSGSAGSAGAIQVSGRNVTIGTQPGTNESSRRGVQTTSRSLTGRTGQAGAIDLSASQDLILVNGALSSESRGAIDAGKAGDITLRVGNTLTLPNLTSEPDVSSEANGSGGGGNITIISPSPLQIENRQITSSVLGSGNGGAIRIQAPEVRLTNSQLQATTSGSGTGGTIQLAAETVNLGNSQLQATTSGRGAGGTIQLTAETANLTNSQLQATTSGSGTGGTVQLNVATATVTNSQLQAATSGSGAGGTVQLTATTANLTDSQLQATTSGSGAGGTIQLSAPTIALTNSQLQARTTGTGAGGTILLQGEQIQLRQLSSLDSSTSAAGAGGNIAIQSRDRLSLDNSTITTAVESGASGRGGDLQVRARSLQLTNGGRLAADTSGQGAAGSIEVNADFVSLQGSGTGIFADTRDFVRSVSPTVGENQALDNTRLGTAQDLAGQFISQLQGTLSSNNDVDLYRLSLTGNRTFSASTVGGSSVDTQLFLFDANGIGVYANDDSGTTLQSTLPANSPFTPTSSGIYYLAISAWDQDPLSAGGAIFPNGSGTVAATGPGSPAPLLGWNNRGQAAGGTYQIALQGIDGVRGNQVIPGSGAGGNIRLQTGQLAVQAGARVSASSSSRGNAGNLQVEANQVQLAGAGSGLFTQTTGPGRGGNLLLQAGDSSQLTVNFQDRAQVSASTSGRGQGGTITVQAPTAIVLEGNGSVVAGTTGSGAGGNLQFATGRLTIQDGAQASVNSSGSGTGGNLTVTVNSLALNDRGKLTAETLSSDGGNIAIAARDAIVLRRNSLISATAGTAQAGGNGGNITIQTPFIISLLAENNDITANAFTGRGGNITITANAIYGLLFQPRLTPFSDITASSSLGFSGSVILNVLNIDPNRGLIALPTNFTDSSRQISQTCSPGDAAKGESRFTITGRGGLPSSPDEAQTYYPDWDDLGSNPAETKPAAATTATANLAQPIVEAQGWIKTPDGTVYLVAEAIQGGVYSPLPTHLTCGSLFND
jgi:filamentous hemagglutinin family protein